MVDAALRADLGMLTGMTHWLLEFVERAKVKSEVFDAGHLAQPPGDLPWRDARCGL